MSDPIRELLELLGFKPPRREPLEQDRPAVSPALSIGQGFRSGFKYFHAEVPGVYDRRCDRVIGIWTKGYVGQEALLAERVLDFCARANTDGR